MSKLFITFCAVSGMAAVFGSLPGGSQPETVPPTEVVICEAPSDAVEQADETTGTEPVVQDQLAAPGIGNLIAPLMVTATRAELEKLADDLKKAYDDLMAAQALPATDAKKKDAIAKAEAALKKAKDAMKKECCQTVTPSPCTPPTKSCKAPDACIVMVLPPIEATVEKPLSAQGVYSLAHLFHGGIARGAENVLVRVGNATTACPSCKDDTKDDPCKK